MAATNNSRAFIILGLLAATALAIGGWFVLHRPAGTAADPKALSFWECATEVGLNFPMHFLPKEQGAQFKINLYDHGCGLAVGDFDGDGFEDIYFCNQLGKNALYRNRGDGTFEDVTEKAGVALGDRVCVAATFVDYDNDGKPDLFVTSTRGGNVLFHNMGGGKFEDVTRQAGLHHVGHSQTAVFFDYDNDGLLDLFLINTAEWTTNTYDTNHRYYEGKGSLGSVALSPKEYNVLYHNNGDGTFTNVTEKAGVKGLGWGGDAVAFDYNDDGYIDLFVTNMFGRSQLFRNNKDGTFTDVAVEVLKRTPAGAVGANLIDYKNDGRLSLFVVDMHSDMWMGADFEHASLEQARKFQATKFSYYAGPEVEKDRTLIDKEKELARKLGFRHEDVFFGNAFYRNDGGGKFTEVSDQAGLETFWPWSIATGDFDNDGWEDAFIPSGMGYPFYYWPNALMMNQGNGAFRDRAAELGIEPPRRGINLPDPIGGKPAVRSSRCAVTADFSHCGRLDIVVNNFNDQPYFFKNQFPRKNYIAFRLRGTKSNRDAIGAVVRVHQADRILTRQVRAACGYLSHSSRTLHFGLGDRSNIDRVEITWPGGLKQQLTNVAPNQLHDIVESEK